MLKARIRNVLGVESAEVDLNGIVLVAGRNGEGKSSLLQAIGAVATGEAAIRGLNVKGQRSWAVRQGADMGVAVLDWGTGTQRVVWPNSAVENTGSPYPDGPFGSPLGIGLREWMAQDLKTRQQEFANRAKASPTLDDIRTWLEVHDGNPAQAQALWERVDISGWDAVLKQAQEASTKVRGGWEQVAGTAFGVVKSQGWRPAGLLPDVDYTEEGVAEDLERAKEARDRLIAQGAIETHRLGVLRDQARPLPELQAEEARLRAELTERRAAQRRLGEQRQSLLGAEDFSLPCPHCGGALDVQAEPGATPELTKSAKPLLMREKAAKRRDEAASVTKAQADAQRAIDQAEAALQDQVARTTQAANAAAEVRRLEKAIAESGIDGDALSQARELVARLEERLVNVQAMSKAADLYEKWAKMQPAIKALEPEGVRGMVAARALTDWNAIMATITTDAGMAAVVLTEGMELTFAGRRYALLSESEKWRANLVMGLALAKAEAAKLLLVDRLDVLVADLRASALKAIRAAGIPAVVAMSVPDKSPERLPHLSKAGLGSVWWIEGGVLQPLPY